MPLVVLQLMHYEVSLGVAGLAFPFVLEIKTKCAPFSQKAFASSTPNPLLAPVIITVLFIKFILIPQFNLNLLMGRNGLHSAIYVNAHTSPI